MTSFDIQLQFEMALERLRTVNKMCDTVTISQRRAIQIASAAITKITEMRRKQWESVIVEHKARRGRARCWMPWLRYLTSEEIRRNVCQQYPNPDTFASDNYRKAQAVLAMANAVEDGECVTISAQTLLDITL